VADGDLTIELDDVTAARVARRLEVLRRLEEIAPAVCRWLELPDRARGRCPDVRPRHRAEVEQLLGELARLGG
jgi:hypothetical protein